MLRVVVLVSGGGTNLQAIIDSVKAGKITNTLIAGVVSNNRNAKGLDRARNAGIPASCISPKDYENRELFYEALLKGRFSGGDPGGYGAKVQQPHYQYPSFFDPFLLRSGLLWFEST